MPPEQSKKKKGHIKGRKDDKSYNANACKIQKRQREQKQKKKLAKVFSPDQSGDLEKTDEYTRKYGKGGLSPRGRKIQKSIDEMCGAPTL